MDKKKIAGIAAVALLGGELLEAVDKFDLRSVAADAPHNHVEMPEETTINVTNNLFASGGQAARVDYYLQMAPAFGTDDDGNRTVVGYDAYGFPDSGTQQMYGRFETLDALLSSLESVLGLGEAQLEATRRSLVQEERTEIGGHSARLYLRRRKSCATWD
jgi:hypothetical protein